MEQHIKEVNGERSVVPAAAGHENRSDGEKAASRTIRVSCNAITELLLEVDQWTGFTRHFTNQKTGTPARNRELLLTAVLADGLNLGLTKMAEACPDATYTKLSWLAAWHIRDETYAEALAEIVNAPSGGILLSTTCRLWLTKGCMLALPESSSRKLSTKSRELQRRRVPQPWKIVRQTTGAP